jgi:hypothetical protein
MKLRLARTWLIWVYLALWSLRNRSQRILPQMKFLILLRVLRGHRKSLRNQCTSRLEFWTRSSKAWNGTIFRLMKPPFMGCKWKVLRSQKKRRSQSLLRYLKNLKKNTHSTIEKICTKKAGNHCKFTCYRVR